MEIKPKPPTVKGPAWFTGDVCTDAARLLTGNILRLR
jgi:hypothetical protein